VINSENYETEEFVGDARVKRPRQEDQGDWQWKKVDDSYSPSKIQFSEISGPIQSIKCALEAFKLYFDNSIMITTVAEENPYVVKFSK
jgi:hypothetical protein